MEPSGSHELMKSILHESLRAGAGILSSMSSGSPSEEEEKPPISKEDSSFLDLDAHDSGDDVGDTELRHLEISLF